MTEWNSNNNNNRINRISFYFYFSSTLSLNISIPKVSLEHLWGCHCINITTSTPKLWLKMIHLMVKMAQLQQSFRLHINCILATCAYASVSSDCHYAHCLLTLQNNLICSLPDWKLMISCVQNVCAVGICQIKLSSALRNLSHNSTHDSKTDRWSHTIASIHTTPIWTSWIYMMFITLTMFQQQTTFQGNLSKVFLQC